MTWDGVLRLRGDTLDTLAAQHGGRILRGATERPIALAPVERAGAGDLAPVWSPRFVAAARGAVARGAMLLVQTSLSKTLSDACGLWFHEHAHWAMASVLEQVMVPDAAPRLGEGVSIAPTAVVGPRVVLGNRVTLGPGAVVGHPGFGWAVGPGVAMRAVPQLGGVVIDDDVSIGPLCTVDAGTLSATRVRRGVKIDAHVHIGHNVDIGEGCIIAAQCGFAGSVRLGRGVRVGGQAGFADHVTVGDGAQVAAKSGVIGDVPSGAIVAGYPAAPRVRWLRAFAKLYGRRGEPE